MTLDSRIIKKMKRDDPTTWPWEVIVYAVMLEGVWMDINTIHARVKQWCEHMGRKPVSRRYIQRTMERLVEKQWADIRDPDPRTLEKPTKQFQPRDMDDWGNPVWPFWKSERYEVTLRETPEDDSDQS